MSHQEKEVRQRTDALDSLGNTTAATGKGFAIGSAALTALALIAAYRDQIMIMGGTIDLSMMNPRTLVGLMVGGMLPFAFCALTMNSVGKAAGYVVVEVRRQFKEMVGIMKGETKPDYARCVSIVTAAAQKEMILPSALAIISPIAIGLVAGVDSVTGMLVGATVTGFVLAIMMANAGGTWDNAKKYIEEGNFGGKGSLAHKAGVVVTPLVIRSKIPGQRLNMLIGSCQWSL